MRLEDIAGPETGHRFTRRCCLVDRSGYLAHSLQAPICGIGNKAAGDEVFLKIRYRRCKVEPRYQSKANDRQPFGSPRSKFEKQFVRYAHGAYQKKGNTQAEVLNQDRSGE